MFAFIRSSHVEYTSVKLKINKRSILMHVKYFNSGVVTRGGGGQGVHSHPGTWSCEMIRVVKPLEVLCIGTLGKSSSKA